MRVSSGYPTIQDITLFKNPISVSHGGPGVRLSSTQEPVAPGASARSLLGGTGLESCREIKATQIPLALGGRRPWYWRPSRSGYEKQQELQVNTARRDGSLPTLRLGIMPRNEEERGPFSTAWDTNIQAWQPPRGLCQKAMAVPRCVREISTEYRSKRSKRWQ